MEKKSTRVIRILNDYELNELDPTGRARAHLESLQGTPYRNDQNQFVTSESINQGLQVIDRSIDAFLHSKNDNLKKYAEWVLPSRMKVARQGGRYEFEHLCSALERYYIPVDYAYSRTMQAGLDFMLAQIRRFKDHRSDDDLELAVLAYEGVTGTSAGLTTMSKKGDYVCETSFDTSRWLRHLLPAVPGERIIKLKERVIFMDACNNVRLVEKILFRAKEILKKCFPYFDGWKNPDLGLRRQITRGLRSRCVNIETDQSSMDQHFSWPVVRDYVLPLYEALLPTTEFYTLCAYCEEAFTQELFMGNCLWSGIHNLFSGQPITNDFETVIHAMGYIGSIVESYPVKTPTFHLVCNGDDVGLLLKDSVASIAGNLLPRIHDCFQEIGFEFSREKERFATGDFSFCKKYYNMKMPVTVSGDIGGAYSPYYALNSIVYPEKTPVSSGCAAVAALQISDNLQYTPGTSQYYDWLARKTKFAWSFRPDEIDYVTARDWWFKVYGERWKPEQSYSFKEILKR